MAAGNTTGLVTAMSTQTLQMTTPSITVTGTMSPHSLLMEPNSSVPLWSIALIALSVLLVISMAFVMTVLLCRIVKDRTRKRHTYSTRSRQGSIRLQGSVSLIKNQESLEVTNTHYRSQLVTAIIPEDGSEASIEFSQEEQAQQATGVHEEPAGEQGLRRVRSNDESLQDVIAGEDSEGGAHMYDTPFQNHGISQQYQSSRGQHAIVENIHSHSIGENFQNNQSESVSTIGRESQHGIETPAVNLNDAVTLTLTFEDSSNLHNIPGFQDPELKGEDEDDDRLRVNVPPNIYSSQILSIAVNEHDEGGYGYQEESEEYGVETTPTMGMGIESQIPSSQDVHKLNTDSQRFQDFDASLLQGDESSPNQSRESQIEGGNYRLTPEGAQEGNQEYVCGSTLSITLHQHDPEAIDEDVVYDQPIIKERKSPSAGSATKGGEDVKLGGVDPRTLFDDPGYTKGMMQTGTGGNSGDSGAKPIQLECQLSTQEHTPTSTDLEAFPFGLPLQHLESSSASKMQTLSVQLTRVPGMKSSIDSLALLDFQDSELNELDPVIASCLRSSNLSDTDDEIVISEV